MILVTGATGKTGSELVRLLSAAKAEFRVLARNPGKAATLFGDKVKVVAGDLGRSETLDGAADPGDAEILAVAVAEVEARNR